MRDPKRKFRHFHDYYSRTYPRYESYTSIEREHDLYNMVRSEIQNNNVIFEHNLYYDISGNINQKFKTNVLCCVGDSISAELSGPIIQEITMILSSPEASVALSAPVVNLIANSQQIHTQTINVIGDAISSGVMQTQMEIGVGNVISEDSLSTQMFIATEKSLQNPEISSAMKEPVANVIPTEEVSSVVVDTAAKGITIDRIIGNNGLRNFIDKNGNGFQDEDEPDIPEDAMTTIIFGGDIGA